MSVKRDLTVRPYLFLSGPVTAGLVAIFSVSGIGRYVPDM